MMKLFVARAGYHLRKARVVTEHNRSFAGYQRDLRQARQQVHLQSVQYMEQIEDRYLQEHKEAMRRRHHDNECSFRKQILTDAYRLQQAQARWRQTDAQFNDRLNKHLHDEDVRRVNRSRILKIMQHESQHYWFNSQNVEGRLTEETIFPEYIASSEYYYKLFAEALAYEMGDLHELHRVTSNEDIIREKNKYLIPLYLTLRTKIAQYKHDPVKELQQRHKIEVQRLRTSGKGAGEQAEVENKLKKELEEKVEALELGKDSEERLKEKVGSLVSIFKTWKEYTNILALTSAQIIKNQMDVSNEPQIHRAEKEVMSTLKSKQAETFVDSIEEDTEELQISFQEYLQKINKQRAILQAPASESNSVHQLDALIREAEASLDPNSEGVSLKPQQNILLEKLTGAEKRQGVHASSGIKQEINPQFLNPKETTSSVQILKEEFKEKGEVVVLLNQLGEIDVRYPKLFAAIWDSIQN